MVVFRTEDEAQKDTQIIFPRRGAIFCSARNNLQSSGGEKCNTVESGNPACV